MVSIRRDEVTLRLFSPSSSLHIFPGGLQRGLGFRATTDLAFLLLGTFDHLDAGLAEITVVFGESDQANVPAWVHITKEQVTTESQESSIRYRCMITIWVQRYTLDYIDTFSARDQRLDLQLQLVENSTVVGTEHWDPSWDLNRANPRPARLTSITFSSNQR